MNISLCSLFADYHSRTDSRTCHGKRPLLLFGPVCWFRHSFCFLFCDYFRRLSPFRFLFYSILPGSLGCF